MAIASVLVFGWVGIFGENLLGTTGMMVLLNRIFIVAFGFLLAAGLWRYALLRAIPTPEGLKVVNLVRTYDLEWAQIVGVGYGDGSAWAMLELTDTEEVAVMAIQRADGSHAQAEASRLAALIQYHHGQLDTPDH